MKVVVSHKFSKDFKKLPDYIQHKVIGYLKLLKDGMLDDVSQAKRLRGYDGYYRIRIGDRRIGIFCDQEYCECIRVLHRKDIYKYFPK